MARSSLLGNKGNDTAELIPVTFNLALGSGAFPFTDEDVHNIPCQKKIMRFYPSYYLIADYAFIIVCQSQGSAEAN